MTLVASFSLQSCPVLLADLLISQWFDAPPKASRYNVPTLHDVNSMIPHEWGWTVVGLRQKVSVFGNKLALAWAGSQLAARSAFREIEHEVLEGEVPLERIRTILEALDLGQLDLFVAGLLVKTIEPGTHLVRRFAWDSADGWLEPTAVHPQIGAIYTGGSGGQDALRVLQTMAQRNISRSTTPTEIAMLTSISVTNILSGEQMRAGEGIYSLYGGGFEFATVVNGEVVKVGDITHFYLDASRLENGCTKIHLRRAVTYDYCDNLLLVGTLELQTEWEYDPSKKEARLTMDAIVRGEPAVYVILPVHRTLSEEERRRLEATPPNLHYSSLFTALYVHLPQRGGEVRSLVHYAGMHAPALGMTLLGSVLEVKISTSMLTKISNMLN
jgi:hypothetical protein